MNAKTSKPKTDQKSVAARTASASVKNNSKSNTKSTASKPAGSKPTAKSRKMAQATVPQTAYLAGEVKTSTLISKQTTGKQGQLLTLLKSASGATMQQMLDATGWQAHSIRGCISAVFRKKMGLVVERISQGSERAYRIVA